MRVGLVGYSSHTGLGQMNLQLARYGVIQSWLVKKHPRYGISSECRKYLPSVDLYCNEHQSGWSDRTLLEFLEGIDCLLFAETPFSHQLIKLAKLRQKKIVCIPMIEWLPRSGTFEDWTSFVDLFLAPTQYSLEVLRKEGLGNRSQYVEWPIDDSEVQERNISQCSQYLFINGNGGYNGRKGYDVIQQALRISGGVPMLLRSQIPIDALVDCPEVQYKVGSVPNYSTLYESGDVLLCPHHIDGLALEPREALIRGIPLILTQGGLWDELPALARIPSQTTTTVYGREVEWFKPDPAELARLLVEYIGADISSISSSGKAWAQERTWSKLDQTYRNSITGE